MPQSLRRGVIFGRSVHRAFHEYRKETAAVGRPLTRVEQAEWLHHSCRRCLAALDITVSLQGTVPQEGLIVSNHLSYLDILCYSSVAPCIFVSKSDVRQWPVFGRLATNGGTIYVDRESKADARRVAKIMEDTLKCGVRVVLFPEGTSSDGSAVMRFHAPLFESAVQAGAAITPAALLYQMSQGDPAKDVCYWGDMTFGPHFLKLLSKGQVRANIILGSSRECFSDRKEASAIMRSDVVALHARLREDESMQALNR
jgi:1-acyl-sn-glycerol-3-phosphate acyltransferase